MSNCTACGATLNSGAAFCGVCGASQTAGGWSTTPAATAATPSVPIPPPVALAAPGLSDNGAGALSYLAGFITGIIFLVIDPYKNSRFVRFHAVQSIAFNIAWICFWIVWTVIDLILTAVTKGLFAPIALLLNLAIAICGFGLWIWLMYSASQGKTPRLPIIGNIAAKQAGL
jgi:uncharacterized membrane protein